MNMYQSPLDEEKEKNKKLIKIMAIALAILFVMSICILVYISYLQKKQLKLYIDDARINLTSDMIIINDDNIYISINDIAGKIGYAMNNGEYKEQYSEDTTKCHLTNKYEAASYIQDSDEIYKTIISDIEQSDVEHEYFTIDEPVFSQSNKLYTTLKGLEQGCNLDCSYNNENNTVEIYTLDYLVKYYSKAVPDSQKIIEQEDVSAYKNKKAVLYNMMVVQNESGKYGVNSLNNETIIGEKYKSITFMEQAQEFVVETEDGKFGIIDKDGKTKISPEYASIKQIDKDRGLYLVSKNSSETSGRTQYGIINKKQKIVVYLEYEQIGINKSDFPSQDKEIDNQYILYGKCIPVKKSNKWGLLDINGNTILPIEYDSLGCKSNASKNNSADSLLLVPEYEAIVVCQNKLYGLFNSSGKELIPALVTDMYAITSSGENQYYLTYQGNTMDVIKYLRDTLGIQPVSGDVDEDYDDNENDEQITTNNIKTQNIVNQDTNSNTNNSQNSYDNMENQEDIDTSEISDYDQESVTDIEDSDITQIDM